MRHALLLLVVALPAFVGNGVRADEKTLEAAARKEAEVTWYVANLDAHSAEQAGQLFTARYGPKVNVVSGPAPVIFQRLTQNLTQNTTNADVFSSIDIGNFVTLKKQGALAAYRPENEADLLPAYRNLDKDDAFQTTSASLIAIAYNTDKLANGSVPKTWTDMLDPKWSDKIALGDPSFSVFCGDWAAQMQKHYGRSYFERLAALRPNVVRSMPDAIKLVASGEQLMTVAPTANVLARADRGVHLAVEYPRDGAILLVTPSAVLKTAPHPNAARLFMNFLLGPQFGRILVKARYLPNRPDVASTAAAPNDVKTIRPTLDEMTKDVPKAAALWRQVFGQ